MKELIKITKNEERKRKKECQMNKLTVLENNNERVLTTKQLAECYGTETNNIKNNFSNNKERFIEGKHYYKLTGEDLREFKREVNDIDLVASNVNQLYLWTEKGASRMCKILDTDKAWEQFDVLEETYFNVKEHAKQLNEDKKNNPQLDTADVINKLLSTIPETDKTSAMLKLVDKFYPTGNSKPIKEAKPKSESPIGLTLDKVVDILRQAYNEAFMAARSNYIVFNKEITYKYSSYNGIGKRELNKFLLENNLVKIEKSCSGITCTCSINKKKIKALYIKADIFNN